jgi:flagellar hook-associated protein 2
MTLGGISFGGLASGLDTGAIIDAILSVERRSISALEGRKSLENQKIDLIGTFEGLVDKLREKVKDLQQASNFYAHELTVGEEGVASFTLSGESATGSHSLEVLSLASANRFAFDGVADADTTGLGAGTVSFTYDGVTYDVAVAAGSDTLNGIAAAINGSEADVTASVVNTGTESSPSYQLVVAGNSTGADFAITGLSSTVAGLTGPVELTAASNAEVLVDGLAVQRSTNLFDDVLQGVSFTVTRVTDTPVTFGIELDPEGIRENVKGFVDAFNEIARFIDKQNSYSSEDGAGGPLFGDSVLSGVSNSIRRSVFSGGLGQALPEAFRSLGLLGIELQSDGTLSIDSSTFEERITEDLESFADFFIGQDDASTAELDERGVFARIEEALESVLDRFDGPDGQSYEGLIDARRSASRRQIKSFDDDIDRLERRLDTLRETLTAKFAALEQVLVGLQSQQAFLSANALSNSR